MLINYIEKNNSPALWKWRGRGELTRGVMKKGLTANNSSLYESIRKKVKIRKAREA